MPNLKYTTPPADILPLKHYKSIKQFENKPDQDIWRAFNRGNEKAFNFIYRTDASVFFLYGAQFSREEQNWFGVKVQLDGQIDPTVLLQRIQDETLENVLRGIFLTSVLSYQIEDKSVIITNPK